MGDSLLPPYDALIRFNHRERMFAKAAKAPEQVRYGFKIGELGFLISPDILSEIILNASVYSVPNTIPWFNGLINLRGNLMPVYDLVGILKLGITLAQPNLLVLDQAEKGIAILIDGLPHAINISQPLEQIPILPKAMQSFVFKGYFHENRIWLDFDHSQFFHSLSTQVAI